MRRALLAVVLAGGLVAVPGSARPQDDGAKKAEKTPEAAGPLGAKGIVDLLHTQRVTYPRDLTDSPLMLVLGELGRQYNVTFVIDNTAFEGTPNVAELKAGALSTSRLEGLTLGRFLDIYLRALPLGAGDDEGNSRATYLVRNWGIEITSVQKARTEAGLFEAIELADDSADGGATARAKARLLLPLVSVVTDNTSVAEVVRKLAGVYGLNVVFDKNVRDAAAQTMVSERLLNVPADTALELLAGQADLQVVRKGNTFRITGPTGQ